jgi:hypothetical protein
MTGARRGVEPRPGGPSAKTFHRAGSPNHQNDSKEKPMVGRLASPGSDDVLGGER